ncbi:MAG: O-antigen ligase family protein [Patescibacteria group bacterium]
MALFEKIGKWAIKLELFTVFALPLIFISSFFFPFIVPKNLIFRIIVEIAFAIYIVLALKYPQYRPKVNFLNLMVLAYFAILTITSLTGLYFPRSFWGNYERMDGLLNQFHFLLYFIILTSMLKEDKDWYELFSFSLGSSFIMSLFALGQKLNFSFLVQTDNVRLAGTIGNAAFFASYLIFHFFFLIFFLFKPKRFQITPFLASFFSLEAIFIISTLLKGTQAFFGIFSDWNFLVFFLVSNALMVLLWLYHKNEKIIFGFLALFLTLNFFDLFNSGTRGALLGIVVSTFLFLVFLLLKGKKIEKIIAGGILIVVLSSVLVVFLGRNTELIKSNPTLQNIITTSYTNITVESRLLTWQSSWQAITASPFRFVFGYGLENFHLLFDKYFNNKIFRDGGSQVWFDRAHNIVFDLWTTSGIFGLAAFLIILGTAIVYLFKVYQKNQEANRDLFLVFSALFICYFIQDLFVFDTLNTYILIFLCLAFASYAYANEFLPKFSFWPQKSINIGIFSGFTVVAILLLVVWIFNVRVAIANMDLVKGALGDHFNLSKQQSLEYLEKSMSYGYLGRFETTQQLMGFSLNLAADKNVSSDFAFQVAQRTIKEFETNIEMDPLNVKNYLYLANFYNDALQYFNGRHVETSQWPQKSIELIDKAIPLSPTRPQLYFVKAHALFYQKKIDQAFAIFKYGVDLAPWVTQSHIDLAVLYIVGDQPDLAQEEFNYLTQRGINLTEKDYLRLANVYNAKKDYAKMAESFIKLTELVPGNVSYYAQVAGSFARLGDNQSAREWAGKALQVNPAYEADIKQFLQDLDNGKFKEQ